MLIHFIHTADEDVKLVQLQMRTQRQLELDLFVSDWERAARGTSALAILRHVNRSIRPYVSSRYFRRAQIFLF